MALSFPQDGTGLYGKSHVCDECVKLANSVAV
jgi:hypothetical protein